MVRKLRCSYIYVKIQSRRSKLPVAHSALLEVTLEAICGAQVDSCELRSGSVGHLDSGKCRCLQICSSKAAPTALSCGCERFFFHCRGSALTTHALWYLGAQAEGSPMLAWHSNASLHGSACQAASLRHFEVSHLPQGQGLKFSFLGFSGYLD